MSELTKGLEGCELAQEALTTKFDELSMEGAADLGGSFSLPEAASLTADDFMYNFVLWLSVICFVGITVAVIYLVVKYRARPGHSPQPSPSHHNPLEITWTIIPALICVFLFAGGWKSYVHMSTPPEQGMTVNAYAQKWSWDFEYVSGVRSPILHAPVDQDVKIQMTSSDVIHSLWVPAFRIKKDVVPSRQTSQWFNATKPGKYRLYCTEYCGKDHSLMKTFVFVHPPGCFEKWQEKEKERQMNMSPEERGEQLYAQYCRSCHTTDGSKGTGPTFKGLWGTERPSVGGKSPVADENYIRESIVNPGALIRQGYPNQMSSNFGDLLSDKDINALIAYIKSLK